MSERDFRYQVTYSLNVGKQPPSIKYVECKSLRIFFTLRFSFQNIMRNLVRRYVTTEQRQADNQGVTEDDVNEIKQDISAFRCELLEVLKNSGMNTGSVTGLTGGTHTLSLFPVLLDKTEWCVFVIQLLFNYKQTK